MGRLERESTSGTQTVKTKTSQDAVLRDGGNFILVEQKNAFEAVVIDFLSRG